MVKEYIKGEEIEISKRFKSIDFDCNCQNPYCQKTLVDEDLVAALDKLDEKFNHININSGYRCEAYNTVVGGGEKSQHLLGKAADICSPFATPKDIADEAERIASFENGGIGLYSTFVHVDTRVGKARW